MEAPKTAVVTGATGGIGAAVCDRLTGQFDRVFGLARREPDDPLEGVEYLLCDVTDESQVEETFSGIGTVGALVNNAGFSSSNPIGRTALDDWNHNIAVNATAPFLCVRAVLDGMVASGTGSIVTIGSTASVEGARYVAAYTASKHAVLGFMRVLSAELEGTGVVAVTVCPTFVRTPMTVATIQNIATRTNSSLSDAEAKLVTATPHGRILEVAEVADAVCDLVGCGRNGQVVVLDGGADA